MIRMQMTRIIALWMAGLLVAAQPCMAMVVGYCRAGGSAWTTILSDGFDGDLSLWTSETDTNSIGSVSGSAYVVIPTASGQAAYLRKTFDSPAPYQYFRVDFYVTVSDVTGVGNAAGQVARLMYAGNASSDTFGFLEARCSAAAGDLDQVRIGYHNGTSATGQTYTFAWVAGQSHHIVAEYYAGADAGGYAKLTIDDTVIGNVTGLSNAAQNFSRSRLGLTLYSLAAAHPTISITGVTYAAK